MSALLERAKAGLPLDEVHIIDVHGHVGPWRSFYIPDTTEEGTLRIMDRIGIDRAVIFSNAGMGSDHVLGNRIVADYIESHPDRFIPLVFPNPRYPDEARSEVEHYCGKLGWRGIKIHPTGNQYPADGPNYTPLWEYAEAHGLPVVCHSWDNVLCNARVFERIAKRFPGVNIVLYHSIKPDFAGAAELARKYGNLFLELTDVAPHNGLIEWLVSEVGSERILYGSDLGGWFSPLHGIGPVLYATISEADKRKILGENAVRVFRL